MHQARGIKVFVPGLEGESGARLLFEKGERSELGDGSGAIGNGESGEEGGYCFWRGGGEGVRIIIRAREERGRGRGRGGGRTARNLTNLAWTPFCQIVLLLRRFRDPLTLPAPLVVSIALPIRGFAWYCWCDSPDIIPF